jgi:hypothetical protein
MPAKDRAVSGDQDYAQLVGARSERLSEWTDHDVTVRMLRPGRVFFTAAWTTLDTRGCVQSGAWVRLWPVRSSASGDISVRRSADGVWQMRHASSGEVLARATERCGYPPESPYRDR